MSAPSPMFNKVLNTALCLCSWNIIVYFNCLCSKHLLVQSKLKLVWCRSGVFIVNFETLFWCSKMWLFTSGERDWRNSRRFINSRFISAFNNWIHRRRVLKFEPRASIVDFEQVSFNCVSWLGQSARVINLNFSLKYYFYNWHLYFFQYHRPFKP